MKIKRECRFKSGAVPATVLPNLFDWRILVIKTIVSSIEMRR
jgi:hypothetical protein